jgi:glutathione S-transferase
MRFWVNCSIGKFKDSTRAKICCPQGSANAAGVNTTRSGNHNRADGASDFVARIVIFKCAARSVDTSILASIKSGGSIYRSGFHYHSTFINGEAIGDSILIVEYLKQTYGDKLDRDLSKPERAIALALSRLLEENLYWVIVYSRWQDPQNWPKTKADYFDYLPVPLRWFVPNLARKSTIASLAGHGMGKHSASEIYQIGCRDTIALSDFLADKPFLMGEAPTSIDATAYAFIANILWVPISSPLQDLARSLDNINSYADRMKAKFTK